MIRFFRSQTFDGGTRRVGSKDDDLKICGLTISSTSFWISNFDASRSRGGWTWNSEQKRISQLRETREESEAIDMKSSLNLLLTDIS